MTSTTLIILIVSVLSGLLCFGGFVVVCLMVLGFVMLRRRGKKAVSAKEAVSAGVESVSQVFMRTDKGLADLDDDDDDD